MDMMIRPRRLRGGESIRRMVRETRMDKSSLIYPMFVKEGIGIEEEIPSMEGQYRYSIDRMPYELERLVKVGVSNVMLFGIPDVKDEVGSQHMRKMELCSVRCRKRKSSFRICTILPMSVCVNILPMVTAVCFVVMRWKMIKHWNF